MEIGGSDNSQAPQIMEVYAKFGLAMYQAQCLERELAIALATVYGARANRIARAELDRLFESNFHQTLGQLINRMRKTVDVPKDVQLALGQALERRNWLAHHYFWDRAGQFVTAKGRNSMIRELLDIANLLNRTDEQLTDIDRAWATARGITEEMRQRALENLIGGAEDGISR